MVESQSFVYCVGKNGWQVHSGTGVWLREFILIHISQTVDFVGKIVTQMKYIYMVETSEL